VYDANEILIMMTEAVTKQKSCLRQCLGKLKKLQHCFSDLPRLKKKFWLNFVRCAKWMKIAGNFEYFKIKEKRD
jgi:hypothetical protein